MANRKDEYPCDLQLADHTITLRLMTPEDADEVLEFVRNLPRADQVFSRWDITSKKGMAMWIDSLKGNRTTSVLAFCEDEIAGYGSLHHHQQYWTRHHGEIRVMVNTEMRGLGLGRVLVSEILALAQNLDLKRLVANIAADQPRVRHMFEDLGYQAVALLPEWVTDRDEKTSDLIIMATELEG